MPPDPGLIDQIKFYMALALTWLGGEVGRVALAGAAGGFVRGLMSERFRLRDGLIAVASGMLMARYATPMMLAMIESWLGPLKGDVAGAAGFAAGLAGMSLTKLVIALIEGHAKRLNGGGGDA